MWIPCLHPAPHHTPRHRLQNRVKGSPVLPLRHTSPRHMQAQDHIRPGGPTFKSRACFGDGRAAPTRSWNVISALSILLVTATTAPRLKTWHESSIMSKICYTRPLQSKAWTMVTWSALSVAAAASPSTWSCISSLQASQSLLLPRLV